MKRSRIVAAQRAVNAMLDDMMRQACNAPVTVCKPSKRQTATFRKGARVCGGQADLYAQMLQHRG